jgi:hypothetical protein
MAGGNESSGASFDGWIYRRTLIVRGKKYMVRGKANQSTDDSENSELVPWCVPADALIYFTQARFKRSHVWG